MLEVVFTDSEKGSMKVAKNYNANNFAGGACSIGYIGEEPTQDDLEKPCVRSKSLDSKISTEAKKIMDRIEQGQAIGGSSQDVVNIGFAIDVGDITGAIDGNERQKAFRKLWGRFNIEDSEREQFFQNQRKDLDKLLSSAQKGTPIRIWKTFKKTIMEKRI